MAANEVYASDLPWRPLHALTERIVWQKQFTRPGRRGDRGGRFQKLIATSAPKEIWPEDALLTRFAVAAAVSAACGLKDVYYAAQHIKTKADFDAADVSVTDALKAIHESKYFVMIYPSRMVSSCIFEAGCAVALRKPSLYFVRDKKHLPFLLQQAGEAMGNLVRIREAPDAAEMTRLICKHQLKLFPS
jgi:hypothetical protein